MQQGTRKFKELLSNIFYYYIEVYESITRVKNIASLQKMYQTNALCLDFKKYQSFLLKLTKWPK